MGILSPLGIGVGPFWENLAAGKSGLSTVELMSYSAAPRNVGGEVKEYTEKSARKTYLTQQRKSIKVMCREIQMGVASASLAMENSGLSSGDVDPERERRLGA